MAERSRGEDGNEDVDAFLKESRDSLHGKYWGPDSLAPVRMVDMREEPPPAPVRKPLRVRPLDVLLGAAGLGAAALIGFSLRHEKQATPAALVAPAVPARKAAPATVMKARLAVAREVPELQSSAASASSAAAPDPSALASIAAGASAEPPPAAPKKRRPKQTASHTPPTASFPD